MSDLDLALTAAQLAGIEVMKSFGRPQKVFEKAPDQPLTAADLAADEILHRELIGARPNYGWLSEETADSPDRLDTRRVWIVDPIDGTRSFIRGYPEFAVSVGLVDDGEVILGVLFNPASGELFWAIPGEGAWVTMVPPDVISGTEAPVEPDQLKAVREGLRVSARGGEGTERLTIFASRSEIAAGEFQPWTEGTPATSWRVEPVGSTAYKLARVASGTGEVFISRGPKSEWDICAGALIVEEAGGRVTDLRGEVISYNRPNPDIYGILATNGLTHDEFLEFIDHLPPTLRLGTTG